MAFRFHQKVLFKHCDPAGIVFYPRYFEMINDTVEAFFDEVGFPFETLHQKDGVPTAQIETTFHQPSRHGDHLVLSLNINKIGGASLAITLYAQCATALRFNVSLTLVYIDEFGKPQRWPDNMRTAFQPFLRSST